MTARENSEKIPLTGGAGGIDRRMVQRFRTMDTLSADVLRLVLHIRKVPAYPEI